MAIVKKLASEEYVTTTVVEKTNEVINKVKSIIDVVELPTEDIQEDVFYRLIRASLMFDITTTDDFTCYCVENLPETGLPAMNASQTNGNIYYNLSDGVGYGYIDETLSAGMSIPVGWYDGATLLGALGYTYNGVITDISDAKVDDSFRLLLSYDYYVYKNEWTKLIFAYEKPPKFDITWDGDMTDRTVIDMSLLGYAEGTYFVKVSDEVLSTDDVIGGTYKFYSARTDEYYEYEVEEHEINTTAYPGAFTVSEWVVNVQSAEELCTALGVPVGYITNGVYYLKDNDYQFVRLATQKRVTRIDSEYLDVNYIDPDNTNLSAVAFSGSWYDVTNKPSIYTDVVQYNTTQSLSSTQKSRARTNIDVYSKSEVDNKISNIDVDVDLTDYAKTSEVQALINAAIGTAIGGSY